MYIEDTITYKQQVAQMICENQDIIEALDIKEEDNPNELMYNYVFPFIYIPNVPETVKTTIGFALNFPSKNNKNDLFKNSELTIYVISHRNHMKTDFGGTRTDLIAGILDKIFNRDSSIGLRLLLKNSEEIIISDTFYARKMTFSTLAFNGEICK